VAVDDPGSGAFRRFHVTHEFSGLHAGRRRAGIHSGRELLQRRNLIRYSRATFMSEWPWSGSGFVRLLRGRQEDVYAHHGLVFRRSPECGKATIHPRSSSQSFMRAHAKLAGNVNLGPRCSSGLD